MLTEFTYNCIDPSGREIKGVISSLDRKNAVTKLREQGLTIIELAGKKPKREKMFSLKKGFGDQDVYNISRELSILLKAGIRIDNAIKLLMNPSMNQELRELLSLVLSDIKAGKNVAQAFSLTGRFSSLFVTMVHVGEAVGNLQTAFENIAQYYKFQIQFKGEIRNALTYPLFLIFASIVTLLVIFNFIIPRFFSIFGASTVAPPLPAKILYTISGWLSFTNLFLAAGFVIISIILWKKINPSKLKLPSLYNYLLHLPLVGRLILNLELSRFSYAMYSTLQSGIEFIKALKLSAAIIQNPRLRNPIEALIEQIKGGRKIADVFSQVPFLPEMMHNMIRVGEGSGNLKEIFFELYQVFDERFKNTTKKVLVLVEPVIIVIMGLIVGLIVVSLILTVMSVVNIKL
ncbi:MAG: type II secretion system F family protein [Syntrophales bacterium]